ncbi:MAG: hypothetical protein IJT62_03215 [Oscillospiraceae bacterium]|nr:hypothetical protein [Oscillospiraceae bacterium]
MKANSPKGLFSRQQPGRADPAMAYGSEAQLSEIRHQQMKAARQQQMAQARQGAPRPSRAGAMLSGLRERVTAPREYDAPTYSADTYGQEAAPDLGWENAFYDAPQEPTAPALSAAERFEAFRNEVYAAPMPRQTQLHYDYSFYDQQPAPYGDPYAPPGYDPYYGQGYPPQYAPAYGQGYPPQYAPAYGQGYPPQYAPGFDPYAPQNYAPAPPVYDPSYASYPQNNEAAFAAAPPPIQPMDNDVIIPVDEDRTRARYQAIAMRQAQQEKDAEARRLARESSSPAEELRQARERTDALFHELSFGPSTPREPEPRPVRPAPVQSQAAPAPQVQRAPAPEPQAAPIPEAQPQAAPAAGYAGDGTEAPFPGEDFDPAQDPDFIPDLPGRPTPDQFVSNQRRRGGGDWKYYFWSGSIVAGTLLTVFAFVYACTL